MSGARKIILGAVTVMSLMTGMAPAFADKAGNGHSNGRGSQESDNSYIKHSYGQGDVSRGKPIRIYDNDRSTLRHYAEDHYKKFCPPELAKKHHECLQYGQPKKRYMVGYSLPETVLYYPVPRDIVAHLHPVPTGYQYVRVDNDVLLMQSATRQIIEAVVVLASIRP